MICMRVKGCRYNPVMDLSSVSQTGFVDLKNAFANNSIPSQIVGAETDYNGIEDPASILGRPSDVFEAMVMESYVKSVGTSNKSEKDSANS